jgi:hydrogenase/urease accessory protein HupE
MYRKRIEIAVALFFMAPAWAILGALSAMNRDANIWLGLMVGGLVGIFVGLAIGGNHRWKFWDHFFGPEQPEVKDD